MREQSEQREQREQSEQSEQREQSEQHEQSEQPEQSEQSEQLRQFVFVASDARAAASEPHLAMLARFPLASVTQVVMVSLLT